MTDGTSPGDGSSIGKCPSIYSTYKCLSTGECNVCGLISGKAQGCDITSLSPVCDADSSTPGTQDTATGKVAQCTACTKSGELYHSMQKKYQIRIYFKHSTSYKPLTYLDGTSTGDGTERGKCPSHYSTYRCLSTGACNVCGLIAGKAEGCDITSTNPVCDADASTSGTQDTATGKVAQCVGCTKTGN